MKIRSHRTFASRRRQLFAEHLEDRRVMAHADVVNAAGPLFFYEFNEASGAVQDSSINNADGTLNGNATTTAGGLGRSGSTSDRALQLSGAGHVSVDNAAAVLASISANDRFTVSLWQKGDAPVDSNSTLINAFDAGNARQILVHLMWGDEVVYFDTAGGAGGGQRINKATTAAEQNQIYNQWNHWTFTKDGVADTQAIYLNGQLWHNGDGADNMEAIVGFFIGREFNDGNPHTGLVDDFAAFNRVLTAAEITALSKVDVIWDGGAGDGNWNNPVNWSGDVNVPDNASEVAVFGNTGAGTVTLNGQAITVDSVSFDNTAGSYNIVGGGANGLLTAASFVQTRAASNTISANTQLNGALLRADAGTLTLSGSLLVDAPTLTAEGNGTVNVTGALTEKRADGRFIRVVNNGATSRLLHISEIEAFAPGVTPAAGFDNANDFALTSKGASFEAATGSLGHATDGNDSPLDGNAESGAATWTYDGVGTSYTADLGQTRNIGTVRVWQRGDGCCQERLQDFSVQILSDNGSGLPGTVVAQRSLTATAPTSSYATFTTQYLVKLIKRGTGTLILGGDNNYSGGTEIQGGELRIANIAGSATGSGPVLVGSTAPQARFVQIYSNGTANREVHIAELEAFATGVIPAAGIDFTNNLLSESRGGSVELTSGTGGHGSELAIANGVQETDGLTWDRVGVNVQAVMDLGKGYDVGTVRIWQRGGGCCQERLQNFTVNLYGDNGLGQPGALLNSQSFPGQVATSSFASFTIPAFTAPATVGRLTGSGTISGAVTVRSGNTLAPGTGVGGVGTLRTGSLTIQAGGISESDISSLGNDRGVVTGTVNIGAAIGDINLDANFRPTANQVFVMLENDGADPTGPLPGIPEGALVAIDGRQFRVSYTYDAATNTPGVGNDLTLTYVPVANIVGGPFTITEGDGLTLQANGTTPAGTPTTTFEWDLNGDNIWTDATGANPPPFTWAQLQALNMGDGPQTFNVRVRSSALLSDNGAATLNITNRAPTAAIAGPTSGVPGQDLDFTFSATDFSLGDMTGGMDHIIDWGDGTSLTVNDTTATIVRTHVYADLGPKTVTLQVRDRDGGLSLLVSHSVNISSASVDANGDLQVAGTDGSDRIVISGSGGVVVRLNNKNHGPFDVTGEIVVRGGDGNDTISIGNNIFLPTQIFGEGGSDYITGGPRSDVIDGGDDNDRLLGGGGADELSGGDGNDALSGGAGDDTLLGGEGRDTLGGDAGHDVLDGEAGIDKLAGGPGNDLLRGGDDGDNVDGGAGHDILVGGDGSDKLYGRDGQDLVIGGAAFDTLYGDTGEDILIGGETSSDADDDLLRDILLIWTTGGSFDARIATLGGPLGLLSDNDITSDTPDVYYGGNGNDWFNTFFGDGIKDKKATDRVRVLP